MSQGPNDPQHPVSPDGKYVWNGEQWVPVGPLPGVPSAAQNMLKPGEKWTLQGGQWVSTQSAPAPTYEPLPWYKKQWGLAAIGTGLIVGLSFIASMSGDDGVTAADDPPAEASSSAPQTTPKPVVDVAALDRWWAANDGEKRKENCIGFRYNEDRWWASLLEANQDKEMPKPLLSEFMASHCTKDAKPIPAVPAVEEEATNEPSASPTEEEAAEEPSVYENFGIFDPVKKSASGDAVVKLGGAADAVAVAVKATHKGESNFVVKSLDADNDSVELLVNEIGNYSGTTVLVLDGEKRLKIDADGPWTITVSPIADMKEVDPPANGRGDAVLVYSGGPADWKIKHKGESNFVVKQFGDDGTDLLINEIGTYSGVQPVGSGPSVITISADGSWSITPD